jgi:hypothetical protein
MTVEQIAAILGLLVGAPVLLELVKRWFETRNLTLQTGTNKEEARDDREWKAMETALERERVVYREILEHEREEFTRRLGEFESRLVRIQEDSRAYQEKYWQERLQRELLQTRVAALESELGQLKGRVS